MNLESNRFEDAPPRPQVFVRVRAEGGWGETSPEGAKNTLSKIVVDLSCFDESDLVGTGRVVGDGVLCSYLQFAISKHLKIHQPRPRNPESF